MYILFRINRYTLAICANTMPVMTAICANQLCKSIAFEKDLILY